MSLNFWNCPVRNLYFRTTWQPGGAHINLIYNYIYTYIFIYMYIYIYGRRPVVMWSGNEDFKQGSSKNSATINPIFFFVKKSGKSFFWAPGTKIKIWIFWTFVKFLYMASISYIKPHFRAPSPLKPLKSRPQGQNLPGFPLIAHSDHRGPVSAQFCGLSCLFLTLS